MKQRLWKHYSLTLLAIASSLSGSSRAWAQDSQCTPNPDFETQLATYLQEVDALDRSYRDANRDFIQSKTEFEIKHNQWREAREKFVDDELAKRNKTNHLLQLFEDALRKAVQLNQQTRYFYNRLSEKRERANTDIEGFQAASKRLGTRALLCDGSDSVFREGQLEEMKGFYQFIESLQESGSTRALLAQASTQGLLRSAWETYELQRRIGEFCSAQSKFAGDWSVLTGALRSQQYVVRDLLPGLKNLNDTLETKTMSYRDEIAAERRTLQEFYRAQWAKENPAPVMAKRAELPDYPRYPKSEVCPAEVEIIPVPEEAPQSESAE